MKHGVYITGTASFFPNKAVSNDEMEDYLGLICGKHSRCKNIVLKNNGIKTRYYALDRNQGITHTNAELAFEAIKKLFNSNVSDRDVELLCCATGNPDQLLPSHASMVHGLMKNRPMEIFSSSGVCLTCLQAFKTAYLSLALGDKQKAICSTSELASPTLLSKFYDEEYEKCAEIGTNPYMAYEKDFLRFMLSDGASAVLLETAPNSQLSLEVNWVEMISYANKTTTGMFMGAELREDGELKGWKEFTSSEIVDRSVMTVKQDIKLLKEIGVKYFADAVETFLSKHNQKSQDIKYVIPHISSMFFYHLLLDEFQKRNLDLGEEKWFTNLTWIGNIASAAIFAGLDELIKTKPLHKGDKILLLVPESGRFSYGAVLLTVA